uniref:Uncharacterized protein n=1 Tax=Odontella aurita TaxID=265563 RepID=A0A7S4HRQ4_9STRA|mmetsp:Transcript_14194/g.41633  ORF Transcript_14194/g.41633 Transcript_14194/m.41633 type:complete len:561 (+) Transcript_14194:159-1841(+)
MLLLVRYGNRYESSNTLRARVLRRRGRQRTFPFVVNGEEEEDGETFPFVVNGEDKEPTLESPDARMIIREKEETKVFRRSAPGSLASTVTSSTPSKEQTDRWISCLDDCSVFSSDDRLPLRMNSFEFNGSLDESMQEKVLIVPGQEEQREELDTESAHDVEERASSSSETFVVGWRGQYTVPNEEHATRQESSFPAASLMQTIRLTGLPSVTMEGRTVSMDSDSFSKLMSEAVSVDEGRHYGDRSVNMADQTRSMDPHWYHPREILANLFTGTNSGVQSDQFIGHRTYGPSLPLLQPKQAQPTFPLPSNLLREGLSSESAGRATVEPLGDDSFIASIRLNTSLSAHDVGATIANPELLTSWFEPIQNIHVSNPPTPQKELDRLYDGEWIDASTSALALPRGNGRCLHSLISGAQEVFGFPSYSFVQMFVERHRNQIVLKLQYSESVFAIHTFTVYGVSKDGNENISAGSRSKIMVKDVIYLEKAEDGNFGCCTWFDDCLWVPKLVDLAVQAAASLHALHLFISCDGNTANDKQSSEGYMLDFVKTRLQNDSPRKPLLQSD